MPCTLNGRLTFEDKRKNKTGSFSLTSQLLLDRSQCSKKGVNAH